MVTIEDRYRQVIQLVGQFKQLTASHVHELLLHDLSDMTVYRTLNELKARGFLHRLAHRHKGGSQGGSEQYIWVLASEGFRMLYGKSSPPARTINNHTLEIASTFVELEHLERAGSLQIVEYLTEPSCHETINGQQLEPDLFVNLLLADGKQKHLWLEVDMARRRFESEGKEQIKSKLSRYWHVYEDERTDYWPDYLLQRDNDGNVIYDHYEVDGRVVLDAKRWFPLVIWIVQDEYRLKKLRQWINEGEPESRELFKVVLLPEFVEWLS